MPAFLLCLAVSMRTGFTPPCRPRGPRRHRPGAWAFVCWRRSPEPSPATSTAGELCATEVCAEFAPRRSMRMTLRGMEQEVGAFSPDRAAADDHRHA